MLIASVLFSLIHLVNLREAGLLSVINQVIYTFGVGALLQALFLRFNNILLPLLLHFSNNLKSFFSSVRYDSDIILYVESPTALNTAISLAAFLTAAFLLTGIARLIFERTETKARELHLKSFRKGCTPMG